MAKDATDGALEDSEGSKGNFCINLLDDSEDEDISRPLPVRPTPHALRDDTLALIVPLCSCLKQSHSK